MAADPTSPILLYDGVCGLCNRFVKFVLRHDHHGRFRFASLQSDVAAKILQRHGLNVHELDTLYVLKNSGQPEEQLFARSDAVIVVLRQIGGFWGAMSAILRVSPRWFRNRGYAVIANNRYRMFGKYEACPLPEAKYRGRFLDS
jgi:predicted DCC family thiol-disulfide oxidoreductase YuxK